MKILKRILIVLLMLPALLFVVWLGIFAWNSNVDLNIPDVDTGSLMPQVQPIPDGQNGYLLIQKLYSEEFQNIRKKHCSEINIDQKICQMEGSDLLFGGSTSVDIDNGSVSRNVLFSSEPFGARSPKNRFITPDEIRIIQSQYLSGEYQQSFDILNTSLDEIIPKMEEIMSQYQFVPVLPKIDIRDKDSLLTLGMPQEGIQRFARNVSYSALLDCLADREDDCVRKTLFLYGFSQKMKEGTTNMVPTMIMIASEKYSLNLISYILHNIELSDVSRSQIKEILLVPIVSKEDLKQRAWQFEYYQTNELVNQTLDLAGVPQDWTRDSDVLSEWFGRLTLDRRETQQMLDACYFQILYGQDNLPADSWRCLEWSGFFKGKAYMPFMEEYSIDQSFGSIFQRKNVVGMMMVNSVVSPGVSMFQKIYENYTIRDKVLEELR
ncbi:MAG: hypothetical protein U0518_00180 [Candidatus Gracilibacteria bacterium]